MIKAIETLNDSRRKAKPILMDGTDRVLMADRWQAKLSRPSVTRNIERPRD